MVTRSRDPPLHPRNVFVPCVRDPGSKSPRSMAFAPSPAGKSGTFPDRRIFARGNSPTPCGSSRQLSCISRTVAQASSRHTVCSPDRQQQPCWGQADRHGDLLRSYPQAETDVDDLGRWTGRCVVDGPQFQGTVVLYSPFRAPTAALDALLTAARCSIDELRNGTRRRGARRRRLA